MTDEIWEASVDRYREAAIVEGSRLRLALVPRYLPSLCTPVCSVFAHEPKGVGDETRALASKYKSRFTPSGSLSCVECRLSHDKKVTTSHTTRTRRARGRAAGRRALAGAGPCCCTARRVSSDPRPAA